MNESDWTRRICTELTQMNAKVFAIVGHEMQEVGWPDRFVAHRRWHGFLEFKGLRTKVGLKQRIIIRELEARGCPAYIVRMTGKSGTGSVLSHDDIPMAEFNGTGRDLLEALQELAKLRATVLLGGIDRLRVSDVLALLSTPGFKKDA